MAYRGASCHLSTGQQQMSAAAWAVPAAAAAGPAPSPALAEEEEEEEDGTRGDKSKCMPCEEHIIDFDVDVAPVLPVARAASEAVKLSKLRYAGSLDSATQWRRAVRKRQLGRCVSSAMFIVAVSMGVLVLGSILGIRFLSWAIISDELRRTSEEGQKMQVEQVSKEILAFFQIGSKMALRATEFYNVSFARNERTAPQGFLEKFGRLQWASLVHSGICQDMMVSQARDPALVNSSADSSCDMDSVLIGDVYMFDMNSETTGLTQAQAEESQARGNRWASTGVILGQIAGTDNLSDPFELVDVVSDNNCTDSDGAIDNGAMMWSNNQLPGTWDGGVMDSGLRGMRWQRKTLVDSKWGLVRKAVLFSLPGPPWAPHSAWGRATIRIADDDNYFGMVNLQSTLRHASATNRDKPVVFVLTGQGELLATSLEDQHIEDVEDVHEALDPAKAAKDQGRIVGLVRADRKGLVKAPIQPVAQVLIEHHCIEASDGELDCDWDLVERIQYIGGYAVVAKPIDDPLATELNLLVVDLVDSKDILGPIQDIDLTLSYLGLPIVGAAAILFILLSQQLTVPLRKARDNMFLLSDMQIDEAIAAYADAGRCGRSMLTEAGELRESFLHAAGALKSWRLKEMERRTLLEEERAGRIQHVVEKAVEGAGRLMHPMVLVAAEEFVRMQELTSYEQLRGEGRLTFLDTEDDVARFKSRNSIIFLSHQWLGWGFPDDEHQTQLKAMKSAVRTASHQMRAAGPRGAWKNTYVWVDYCSIAQEHRGMQTLAVSSLPVYASSADVFVIVAPPAKHVQSQSDADLQSYNSRGWCRAEMLSKICSSGLENFFVLATEDGELQQVTEEWLPSLSMYVFEGEFSCCQRGHRGGCCDKEALVEPVLGLYSLALRQASDACCDTCCCGHMDQVLHHIRQSKERFFPKKYTYNVAAPDGEFTQKRELFGPLVEALEQHLERERGVRREDSLGSCSRGDCCKKKLFWVF